MARFLTHKKFKRLHAELSVGKGTRVNYQKLVPCKQSEIAIGESSIINARLSCQKECSAIAVGNQVYIGDSSIVSSHSVIIEDHAMISFGCYITDTDGHSINHEIRRKDVPNRLAGWKDWSVVKSCPVKIEANSWIGPSVIILKGVTIGEGAIIGAGSVVTKDIPPFTVCAGNPAKIIRNLDRKKNA